MFRIKQPASGPALLAILIIWAFVCQHRMLNRLR